LILDNKHFTKVIISVEQPPEFTEDNLNTIFLLSESFLCISDKKSTLQFFNPAFSRVLGYNDDELLAKRALDFLHPLDKEDAKKKLWEEKTPFSTYENRYQCKDKSFRTIRWTSHIKNHRQYAVGTDITETRKTENETLFAARLSDLRHLQEVEAYSVRQTEFIAQLSHEIRNPLSGIYGLMDILKDQIKQVEDLVEELHSVTSPVLQASLASSFTSIQESFTSMIDCAEYQKAILNDNLDISKISEKKLILENNPFEIKKALKHVLKMLQATADRKGLVLTFASPEQPEQIWVKGDSSRFQQIFMNLIGNAIKFTETGNIDAKLALISDIKCPDSNFIDAKIDIIDTGIGLSEEELKHLFERFSQATPSTSGHYGGSGLGLYLAKQLALAMNGDIRVTSVYGKSSTFSVNLRFGTVQLQENDVKANVDSELGSNTSNNAPTSSKKRKVLIVDDNMINLKILTHILKDCLCQTASNGLEALDAFANETFDVILMDIVMPKMDGITATKEIRKQEKEQNRLKTPIFAISANALARDQIQGLEAGIDLFLTKPFKKHEIRDKIANLDNLH